MGEGNTLELELNKIRDTKTKTVFGQDASDGTTVVIDSAYFDQGALAKLGNPSKLKVTIEVAS